jgi:hypothetical protein
MSQRRKNEVVKYSNIANWRAFSAHFFRKAMPMNDFLYQSRIFITPRDALSPRLPRGELQARVS